MSTLQENVKETADEASKDACFQQVADVANELIKCHGKEFAMGTLVIAARFIAEGKPLSTMSTRAD